MISHIFQYLFLLLTILILGSCGTTQLIVMNNIPADIYLDKEFIGTGKAEIDRMGPPKKSTVIAKYEGREIGSVPIKRRFDFVTFLAGYFSYGLGFFLCWRYPEMVLIPSNISLQPKDPWQSASSPWDAPPSKWNTAPSKWNTK